MNVQIFATLFLTLLMNVDTVRGNVNAQTNNLTVVAEYLQGQLEPLNDPLKLVPWMMIKEIEERTKQQIQLENKITELETKLDRTISELNSQQTKAQASEIQLGKKITDLQAKLKSTISELKTQTVAIAAFSARVSTDLSDLAVNQTVPFQDVITNIGGGYHQETSLFRCPFRGLYEFTVTIVTLWNGDAETALVAGGVPRMITFAFVKDDAPTSGSNYVLLELQKGDTVYVRLTWPEQGSIIRSVYSTFSGRLIHKL